MAIPARIRRQLHERAFGCCEACGMIDAHDAHHRKRQSQGGLDTLSNLLLLCRRCHRRVHNMPKSAKMMGLLLHPNAEPTHEPAWRYDRMRGLPVLVLLRDDGTIDEEVAA